MTKTILYGMPGSLYTAKARSYLRKQTIPFEERAAGDPRFAAEIVPKTGRWIVPVVQTSTGQVIQDSADIIDHFETSGQAPMSAMPKTPLRRTVSLIFELFGGEGLLRPAMHYRWNFDQENLDFLKADFTNALAPAASDAEKAQIFEMASGRMRQAAETFGVTRETYAAVEESYARFLDLFDAHLRAAPYLLGAKPTIGDYGLIAPLYAHLARDPAPAALMKRRALRVWRWTERMNAPNDDAGEYLNASASVDLDDAIPATVQPLLNFVAEDYLPELIAATVFAKDWLAKQGASLNVDKPLGRAIGKTSLNWRGHAIAVGVFPYRFWMLQRIQDAVSALPGADQTRIRDHLHQVGLEALLDLNPGRRIIRRDNREWWGAVA